MDPVWYVSYGANMDRGRFGCYLYGGAPAGGAQANPGCRDRTPPRADRAVWLAGGVYFGLASRMWGGGLAMLDPALPGAAPARAYLVRAEQFSDIAAQEMYRSPGQGPDPADAVGRGRAVLGEGRYETLLHCGDMDGLPMLTFTAPWSSGDVAPAPPAAAYLRVIATGLEDAHRWGPQRTSAYLATRPGASTVWTPEQVRAVLAERPERPERPPTPGTAEAPRAADGTKGAAHALRREPPPCSTDQTGRLSSES